jgi:hypothetical protein
MLQPDVPTDSLLFLIDGQRASAKVISSGSVAATAEIPIDLALSMANAHSVEIESGSEQLKMTDYQMQGLRKFLTAIGFTGANATN